MKKLQGVFDFFFNWTRDKHDRHVLLKVPIIRVQKEKQEDVLRTYKKKPEGQ